MRNTQTFCADLSSKPFRSCGSRLVAVARVVGPDLSESQADPCDEVAGRHSFVSLDLRAPARCQPKKDGEMQHSYF